MMLISPYYSEYAFFWLMSCFYSSPATVSVRIDKSIVNAGVKVLNQFQVLIHATSEHKSQNLLQNFNTLYTDM